MKTNEFLGKQRKESRTLRIGKRPKPTTPKSSHKHAYEDCLITCIEKHPIDSGKAVERCYRAQYCTVCGKITNLKFFETERSEYGCQLLHLSVKEMQERYPTLITFTVDDIWKDRFVKIE